MKTWSEEFTFPSLKWMDFGNKQQPASPVHFQAIGTGEGPPGFGHGTARCLYISGPESSCYAFLSFFLKEKASVIWEKQALWNVGFLSQTGSPPPLVITCKASWDLKLSASGS